MADSVTSDQSVRVAVVGATGAVGQTIISLLGERNFPASDIVPFASERSAGKELAVGRVQSLSDDSMKGFDIALFSAGSAISEQWAPKFAENGATVIDNSSFWRMHEDVPLVVAEVNPEAAKNHKGIIANPNCSTMQMVVALKPIHDAAGIERIVISTYQATSGTGVAAINELKEQARAVLDEKPIPHLEIYPHQIAFNVLPQVERFADSSGYTTEEQKMMRETQKILGDNTVKVNPTCVRVPVINGHSESVNFRTRKPISIDQIRDVLTHAPSVIVLDDPQDAIYPVAIQVDGRDEVFVGRIREDITESNSFNMWIVGDNLRKGAATNAVQIAELILEGS